jgi:hypothetical protein
LDEAEAAAVARGDAHQLVLLALAAVVVVVVVVVV